MKYNARWMAVFVVILIAIIWVLVAWPQPHAVQAVQPDPRIRWTQYDVSGMLLVNPSAPDSVRTIYAPPGSWLLVPSAVPPDSV